MRTNKMLYSLMNTEQELRASLQMAAEYFEKRGLKKLSMEALHALDCMNKNDYSFVEALWLKYAPTCEIDDLIIIDFTEENEDKTNALNDELAEVANRTFAALDKLR